MCERSTDIGSGSVVARCPFCEWRTIRGREEAARMELLNHLRDGHGDEAKNARQAQQKWLTRTGGGR